MATKDVKLVENAGLLELFRVVLNLYNKNLASKDEIKQLVNTLKDFTTNLPDTPPKYLN